MGTIQLRHYFSSLRSNIIKSPLTFHRLSIVIHLPLLILLCFPILPVNAKDGLPSGVTAAFDWTMPNRTIDSNGDGLIDTYRTELSEIAPPGEGWLVVFDACASESEYGFLVNYEWYINGTFISNTHLCGSFSHYFQTEGTYEVKLVATNSLGISDETIRYVTVQDWLIVAIGDSYGSGEGNPDYPMSDESFSESQDALIELGDQLNNLKNASDELKANIETLDQRLVELQQAKFDLNAVLAELQPLENAFNAWTSCDSIEGCAIATANLITKLIEAGIEGAEALLTEGIDAVRARINSLSAAARAAVATAESAVTTASTLVATAEEAFETAETVVADAIAYWNSTHPDDLFPGHDVIYPGDLDPLGGLSWPAAVWKDGRCNRSAYSGQAKAALAIEEADPRTSVTFLHLSCSGATIADGLVGPYNGPGYKAEKDDETVGEDPSVCDPETEIHFTNEFENTYCMLKPQVERVGDMIGNREIDALLVSIGGNDVYFAPIVEACIMQEPCFAENFYGTDLGAAYLDYIDPLVTAICDPLYPLQPFWDPAGGETVYYACHDFFTNLADIVTEGNLVDFIDPLLSEKITAVAEDVCPLLGTLAELSAQCRSFFDDLESQVYEDIGDEEPSKLKTAYQLSEEGFGKLQDEYISLSNALYSHIPEFNQEWLFITEYGNAARDENEELCYFDWLYPLRGLPLGSVAEMEWVEQNMIQRLDTHIASLGIEGHENNLYWNPVSGIYAAATPHGYCAEENWVHRIQDSLLRQGEILGAVHPTPAAHDSIAMQIYSELINKLYTNGDLLTPRIPQQPPVADTGGPYVVDEGSEQLISHGTFDYNNDTIAYSWALVTSEPWNLTFDNSILEFPTLIAKDDYSGTLILTASDNDGSSTDSTTITVKNVAPVIIDLEAEKAHEGDLATLTAIFNDPGTEDTHAAEIDWDDGNISNFSSASAPGEFEALHSYCDNGTFHISVMVTDDDGGLDKALVPVEIYNKAPIIDPIADRTVAEGTRMTGTVTYSDAGSCDTHSVTMSYGDGSPPESFGGGGSVPLDHVYADDGNYKVEVCVQDDDGAESCLNFMVTVTNQVPVVEAGTDKNVTEGYEISVDTISFNDPGTLDTHNAAINWGDGSEPIGGVVTETPTGPPGLVEGLDGQADFDPYVYADNGAYTVNVCVTDDDAGTGCNSFTATVINAPPTISSFSAGAGQDFFLPLVSIPLEAQFNDRGTLDTHTAIIDWDDGTVDDTDIYESPFFPGSTDGMDGIAAVVHTYSAAGSYSVILNIYDDDGDADTATLELEVVNPVEATERIVERLADLASSPDLDPYDRNLISEALKDLEGTLEGKPNSGALDKIRDEDFAAALLKIIQVLEHLESIQNDYAGVDFGLLKLVLTQISESIAADLLDQAKALIDWTSPGAVKQIEKLTDKFNDGQNFKNDSEFIMAVEKFHEVVKGSLQILF